MCVDAVIFLIRCKSAFPIDLISFALLQQALFHIVAPGPPSSLESLSRETRDAPADRRSSSNSRQTNSPSSWNKSKERYVKHMVPHSQPPKMLVPFFGSHDSPQHSHTPCEHWHCWRKLHSSLTEKNRFWDSLVRCLLVELCWPQTLLKHSVNAGDTQGWAIAVDRLGLSSFLWHATSWKCGGKQLPVWLSHPQVLNVLCSEVLKPVLTSEWFPLHLLFLQSR